MKYYWILVRPINLLLTVLTQFLFMLAASRIDHSFLHYDFQNFRFPESITTMLACILVAAGGYVINDLFDIETDKINRPEKLIISRHIQHKTAIIFYSILTVSGIIFGFLSGLGMGLLCIALAVLLYFYSSDLKGDSLEGNLLISLMAGMVVYLSSRGVFVHKNTFTGLFSILAFSITMTRELIKDIEDIEGDKAHGYETFAVKRGVDASKKLSLVFMLISIAMIWGIGVFSMQRLFIVYSAIASILPLLYVCYLILKAKNKKEYRKISDYLKIIMFIGLISCLFT